MKEKINFTQGDMLRATVLFSVPLIFGELLQNLYNSVDAFVVGNFVDQYALAAVTVCGVIANMIVNFFNGMSVGANVAVAKANGSGDQERTRLAVRSAFSFGVVLGVVLSVFSIMIAPQLLRFTGAQESYFAEAEVYLRIYLAGLVFTVIYNNAAGILRALGRADIPFRILVISCGMNIALDLLLTGALHMGVVGVGIATVVSQGTSAVLIYRATSRCIQSCCFDLMEMIHLGKGIVVEILSVGAAAGIQSALIGFSNIFVTRYMNWFDAETVAGIGVAQRLDRFVILPAKSFGITMTTCVGQNLGAGNYARIKRGERGCMAIAFTVTLALSAIVYFFASQCVALFNPNPAVVETGVAMMHVLAPMFWIMAVREVLLGVLRGCGHSVCPTVLSLIGMVGVRQAFLAFTMHYNPAIENIYYCYPIAWAATLLLLVFYYLIVRRRLLPSG